MRPLRFRAWDKKKRKMEYDICRLHFNDGAIYGILTWEESLIMDFELMQFIGLHDHNGKEIWEGDIVRYTNNEGYDVNGSVIWLNEEACFYLNSFPLWQQTEKEVIGNIFENADLLKGEGNANN